jgi:hypothetical protein
MADPTIVRLRPTIAAHWRSVGALIDRIPAFMRRFQLESDPAVVTAHVTSFWATGAETVALWVMLDGEAVVGHLIAVMESLWGVPYAMVLQVEVDHPYMLTPEQHQTSLDEVKAWAVSQGATRLKMLTPRDPDAWARHSGFMFDKALLSLSLSGGTV